MRIGQLRFLILTFSCILLCRLGLCSSLDSYEVNIFNVDDVETVYVNGVGVIKATYNETKAKDIRPFLKTGSNSVKVTLENTTSGWTYGFAIHENGKTYYSRSCGKVGKTSCDGNTSTGIRYNQTFDVHFITATPDSLPTGKVDAAYPTTVITPKGGREPYNIHISTKDLPEGMTLVSDNKSLTLSGTPKKAGLFHINFEAYDEPDPNNEGSVPPFVGTFKYTFSITTPGSTCSYSFAPASLPGGAVGVTYPPTQITATGGTGQKTYSGDTPQGLNLSSSGLLSGTPAIAGTFPFVVKATDAAKCSGTRSYSLVISGSGGGTPTAKDVSQSSGIAKQDVETTGVQWVDFNKDHKIDLFLAGKNGNALFKNLGNGKFAAPTKIGSAANQSSNGAAWADFDNDGDPDVAIFNSTGEPTFLKNNNGAFVATAPLRPASISAGVTQGGIWFDYNRDGKVDAYIVKDGGPNELYENRGSGQFSEIGAAAHINLNSHGRSAVSGDFNGDRLPDLYIVNSHAPNKLYINNGNGTFRSAPGGGFNGACVQAIAGDYNNDKRVDLFVVNNAGASILYKNAGTNSSGNPSFVRVGAGIAATHGRSAAFVDYNNDGFQDLVLVQSQGGNFLYQNNGHGGFTNAGTVNLNNPHNPTGLTIGDFNKDGLEDIMIGDGTNSQTNGDSLYQNGSAKNHWLAVALQATTSNKSAIGAYVQTKVGLTYTLQQVSGGSGQNQDSLALNFGLGSSKIVDELDIFWPSGNTQICFNVSADRSVTITENNPSNLGCH